MSRIPTRKKAVKFYLGKAGPGSLHDVSSTGKTRPWVQNKVYSVYLAQSYQRLQDYVRAGKIMDCGTWLKFSQCPSGHREGMRLTGASFCRQRLCPMCAWRRSLLVAGQVQQIAHQLHKEIRCRFLMLTLTMCNVGADDLPSALSSLSAAYSRFIRLPAVKKILLGSFRAVEVTVSRSAGYHPHIHALLAVPATYFKSGYLTQDDFTSLWQKALKVDYQPILDIRSVKAQGKGLCGAAAEVAKYTLKPSEFLDNEDWEWTDAQVDRFHSALKGRRSYAFTGRLKEIYRQLFGDTDLEAEDADLVDAPDLERCTCPVCSSDLAQQVFSWSWSAQGYYAKGVNQ